MGPATCNPTSLGLLPAGKDCATSASAAHQESAVGLIL